MRQLRHKEWRNFPDPGVGDRLVMLSQFDTDDLETSGSHLHIPISSLMQYYIFASLHHWESPYNIQASYTFSLFCIMVFCLLELGLTEIHFSTDLEARSLRWESQHVGFWVRTVLLACSGCLLIVCWRDHSLCILRQTTQALYSLS